MIRRYEIFMRSEAVLALRLIKGSQRAKLASYVDSLASDPFQIADYTTRDSSDRDLSIKVIGSSAMTFWVDHAGLEVKIIDIRRADRA